MQNFACEMPFSAAEKVFDYLVVRVKLGVVQTYVAEAELLNVLVEITAMVEKDDLVKHAICALKQITSYFICLIISD